ncbi:MAG: metalloregulator ArsR/SmtB family transcription factor [Atribacterota bacterium]|nr:metalloregulator ArsR/SmtB family transcription factor [Atribacterota bacterium]
MTQINKYIKKKQKDIEKGCCGIPGIPNPRFLKAVSDSTRLQILAYLAEVNEPQIVNEIAKHFPIDVSVVSRHLAILRNEGILLAEKQGKEVYYSVRYEFLSSSFRDFANAIESCCPPKEEVK